MPNNNRNLKQDLDITEIKNDVKWIKKEIENIKTNHLKSIYQKLESQKNWLLTLLGMIILTLIGTIFNILIK